MDRRTAFLAAAAGSLIGLLLAICLAIAWWALEYQAGSASEKPSAADWLQGWGTIYGLVATSIAAVVAGGVYYETVKAAKNADEARREDQRNADLRAPRAVLVTRIGPGMEGEGRLGDWC